MRKKNLFFPCSMCGGKLKQGELRCKCGELVQSSLLHFGLYLSDNVDRLKREGSYSTVLFEKVVQDTYKEVERLAPCGPHAQVFYPFLCSRCSEPIEKAYSACPICGLETSLSWSHFANQVVSKVNQILIKQEREKFRTIQQLCDEVNTETKFQTVKDYDKKNQGGNNGFSRNV